MKSKEIIDYIVRGDMPDLEQVRKNCHQKINQPEIAIETVRTTMKKRTGLRKIGMAVCIACIICLTTIPVLGVSIAAFNDFLYDINPQIAQFLTPISLSDTEQDIKVEVVAAMLDDTGGVVYFTIQDIKENRLNYNSRPNWDIREMSGGGYTHSYDKETGTLLCQIVFFGKPQSDMMTFSIQDFYDVTGDEKSDIIAEGNWRISFKLNTIDKAKRISLQDVNVDNIAVTNFEMSPISISYTAVGITEPSDLDIEITLQDGSVQSFAYTTFYNDSPENNNISMWSISGGRTHSTFSVTMANKVIFHTPVETGMITGIRMNGKTVFITE